ncbi:MAG: Ig-like domain-containing protein [Chloroflexi bacterium]|nr:Ig-like domain-containing protein [Chloroflexota bacterium]
MRYIVQWKRLAVLAFVLMCLAPLFGASRVQAEPPPPKLCPDDWCGSPYLHAQGHNPPTGPGPISQDADPRLAGLGSTNIAEVLGVPTVSILQPIPGASQTTRDVLVKFSTSDHAVGSIGTPHIHFHLDGDPIPFMFFNGDQPGLFGNRTVFFDFDPTSRANWISQDTLRFNGLAPGTHTLEAYLVDGSHNRLANPEAGMMLNFNVDVTLDDATPPAAILFVKQNKISERVFDSAPRLEGDLYKLSPPTTNGTLTQLTDVARNHGGVMHPEVDYSGTKVVFSMRKSEQDTWHLYEMKVDGTGLRQITFDPPGKRVNDIDPNYLPEGMRPAGAIVFSSDRLKVRDEYNIEISSQIYIVNGDGSNLQLLDPNPSHSLNPIVAADGRIIIDRWDHQLDFNRGTAWHMNQDGSSSFVLYGGASPGISNVDVKGFERAELVDGQFVGIFTHRDMAAGRLGIFDNRGGNLEALPKPVYLSASGVARNPRPLTTYNLIYSYSADEENPDFGLYTVPYAGEMTLVNDVTTRQPPAGSNTINNFAVYTITLPSDGRFWVEVRGRASANNGEDDDDLGVEIDGTFYGYNNDYSLNGSQDLGLPRTIRIDVDGATGQHIVKIRTQSRPVLNSVRIVQGVRYGAPQLLYNDPLGFEMHPVPVRPRTPPPAFNSTLNLNQNWGTVIVRDISLRGDFRQVNHNIPEVKDPTLLFHLDVTKLSGLRVFQAVPRRGRDKDVLVGSEEFEPVKVLGVAPQNSAGTVQFQIPAGKATAWHVMDKDGAALVKERIWIFVESGEIRACGGCHVPVVPYLQRQSTAPPAPTDLRGEGEVIVWTQHILPIVQNKCQSCHVGNNPAGGLNLFGDRVSFNRLRETISGRNPQQYVDDGSARTSFLFQLLVGNAHGDSARQTRITAINNSVNHTTILSRPEQDTLASWIDTGAGFIFLPDGEVDGPPRTTNVNPRDGTTGVPTNTRVVVEFSEAIDPATFNTSTFTLVPDAGGANIPGVVENTTDRIVTFRPTSPLAANTTYRVVVGTGVRDTSMNSLATSFTSRFTTGGSADATPPAIASRYPSGSEATSASVNGPISIDFGEVIDGSSFNQKSFTVVVKTAGTSQSKADSKNGTVTSPTAGWEPAAAMASAAGTNITGRIGISRDSRRVTFLPDYPLDLGATYTVRLTTGIMDLAGNHLAADYTFDFTTAASPPRTFHALVGERNAGKDPQEVALTPDGTTALVASSGGGDLLVFDAATYRQTGEVLDLGSGAFSVVAAPDNTTAYVILRGLDKIKAVNFRTGAILGTVSGISDPYRMAIAADGNWLYVTSNSDSKLVSVDLRSGSATRYQVVDRWSVSAHPDSVALSSDGKRAYVTSDQGLDAIDLQLKLIFAHIDGYYLRGIAITPDQRQAYIADAYEDSINVVDLEVNTSITSLSAGDYPDRVAVSPDGQRIYVGTLYDHKIYVFDRKTNKTLNVLPAGGDGATGMAVHQDGRRLFYMERGWPGSLKIYQLGDNSDTTPPSVTAVNPTHGSAGIGVNSAVAISLSEPMDRLSMTSDSVQVMQNALPIYGVLTFSDDNKQVYFRPGTPLLPGTSYNVAVKTAVRDTAGNSPSTTFSSSFSTASIPTPPLWPMTGQLPVQYIENPGVSPNGRYVLAPDYYENQLVVFDANNGMARSSVVVGNRPIAAVVLPDNQTAYVLNHEGNDVSVVNLATMAEVDLSPSQEGIQRIRVGSNPYAALAHPTRKEVYVLNQDSGDLSIINTDTRTEAARVSIGGSDARAMVFSPDAARLYISRRDYVVIFDIATRRVTRTIETGYGTLSGIAVSPDETLVYVLAQWYGALKILDLRSGEFIGTVNVESSPAFMATSPDGNTLYIANQESHSISIVDRRTDVVVSRLPLDGDTNGLVVKPNGQQIYVANYTMGYLAVYSQGSISDNVPPTLASILPADQATEVSLLAPVVFTFNEPVDRSSINNSTVQIVRVFGSNPASEQSQKRGNEPDSEVPVGGTLTTSADNMTIYFVPTTPLLPGTRYSVRVDGVTDLAGNRLYSQRLYTFTTASLLNPPAVSRLPDEVSVQSPQDLYLIPAGGLLLVVAYYQDAVLLYDPQMLEQLGSINVGDGPISLVVSPNRQRAYVTNNGDDSISVIDLPEMRTINTFTHIGQDLRGIALNADGSRMYVADYSPGKLYVFDTTTGGKLGEWSMSYPTRPVLSPDGRTIFVPGYDRVYMLNLSTGSVSEIYTGWGRHEQLIFSPNWAGSGPHQIYVTASYQDAVQVIDMDLGRMVGNIPVGGYPTSIQATPDGRLLFVANSDSSTISIVDRLTASVIHTVDVGGGWLNSIWASVDQQRIYVSNSSEWQLQIFNLGYTNNSSSLCAADDVDCNGVVDNADVVNAADYWHADATAMPEDSAGNRSDVNDDGKVNIVDLMLIMRQMGH